jgi:uncharacterized damage-inducible protein DinB
MHGKVSYIFDRAEKDRLRILELIATADEEKLSHHPSGKWSINQILSHLITAERLSLLYMKKKSLGIHQVNVSGLWEEIKFALLKISQRVPIRYKAPAVLAQNKPEKLSYSEIVAQWTEVRNELKAFLQQLDAIGLQKKIYKHPVAGRLNVLHAVSFLREHANHHLPQIKRLL